MSTRRTAPGADRQKPPHGPNGERLCRWCKGPVSKGRRTFCSDPCIHEWRLRTDPGYVRHCVERRDKGVCAKCGRDTRALQGQLFEVQRRSWLEWKALKKQLGIPAHRVTLWDADHIVEVVNGGGECDLSNYQTLCYWCHKEKTAQLNSNKRKGGEAG